MGHWIHLATSFVSNSTVYVVTSTSFVTTGTREMKCQMCDKECIEHVVYQGNTWHMECLDAYIKIINAIDGDEHGSGKARLQTMRLLRSTSEHVDKECGSTLH